MELMWRLEDIMLSSVLFLHHVGPRDGTQTASTFSISAIYQDPQITFDMHLLISVAEVWTWSPMHTKEVLEQHAESLASLQGILYVLKFRAFSFLSTNEQGFKGEETKRNQ